MNWTPNYEWIVIDDQQKANLEAERANRPAIGILRVQENPWTMRQMFTDGSIAWDYLGGVFGVVLVAAELLPPQPENCKL
jgi:hypothetical protein